VRYGRAVLADDWWFWALTGAVAVACALGSARYRTLAAAARRMALERRLVEPGPGRRVDTRPGGFWSDLSWVSLLLGVWIAASPWIWGYDDVDGAVPADVAAGIAVFAVTIGAIALPSLSALNVLAGLWLVLAPWVVGYGSEGGPVGLSDVVAGALVAALALAALAAASRRIVPGGAMPIGRVRRPDDNQS
jgi:SPW repeat